MPTTHTTIVPARRSWGHGSLGAVLALLACAAAGCAPDQVAGAPLPPNVPDPATIRTPAGAVAAYRGALSIFRNAVGGDGLSAVPMGGLLTDELQSAEIGLLGSTTIGQLIDSRNLGSEASSLDLGLPVYDLLQGARGQAEEAHGLLQAYTPDSAALLGEVDALQAYAEIYLADLFCSGIPLSTLDYNGNFTYKPGSTTEQVYTAAAALLDTALSLTGDSARYLNFARVGKGRALLALGQYAAAAQAVAAVPDTFRYALTFSAAAVADTGLGANNTNFLWADAGFSNGRRYPITMSDREGTNGLPFVSSGDPRTAAVSSGFNQYGYPITLPAKYDVQGDSSIVIASGVEARLIQAEAALQAGDPAWLATVNALRTDGTFDTAPDPNDTTKTDTLWHAGSGGVPGLAPLADPGTRDAEVDLLFQERASWLYLTGERQSDLRRLIRQYGRLQQNLYPTGIYPGAHGTYGSDVTVPIPSSEKTLNPLFTGCFSRGG